MAEMALAGLDLIVEGRAAKVTDQATLGRLAQRYAAQGMARSSRRRRHHCRI
jgi:hypothetical protein